MGCNQSMSVKVREGTSFNSAVLDETMKKCIIDYLTHCSSVPLD